MTDMPPSPPLAHIAAAIRRERQRSGMSLSELARRAGVAKSTLSQLESATGNPSVETLWALGVTLGVPLSTLVDPPKSHTQVIRAGEGYPVPSERAHYTTTLLATCPPNALRDIYLVRMEPGSARESDPHMAGTIEHLVVGTGRVLAGPIDAPVELAPGDYITYRGDLPHVCQALTPNSTAVVVMEYS